MRKVVFEKGLVKPLFEKGLVKPRWCPQARLWKATVHNHVTPWMTVVMLGAHMLEIPGQ